MLEENVKPRGSVKEKSGASPRALRRIGPMNFQLLFTFFMAKEPSLVYHPGRDCVRNSLEKEGSISAHEPGLGQSFTAWNQELLSQNTFTAGF